MSYAASISEEQKLKYVTYAIQIGILESGFQKLLKLFDEIIPIRKGQAQNYQKINIQNHKLQLSNNSHHTQTFCQRFFCCGDAHTPINSISIDEVYPSYFLEQFYTHCAVAENIVWDQMGVCSVLCSSISYSLLNFSSITLPNQRSHYLLWALLFNVSGIICEEYAKHLAKNTPKIEKWALAYQKANRQAAQVDLANNV